MTHPLPDHERGSSPAGAAALRLATLAFASPLPQGSWAQRRQSNLQKDFYTGHVATALTLGFGELLTFDRQQGSLAEAEGMDVPLASL